MNKELMFIIRKLANRSNFSKCLIIQYGCSEIGCNNCPFSYAEGVWKLNKIVPYGKLIKEVSEYE